MIFKPKNKGFFVEKNEYSWMLARASSSGTPCTLEQIIEVPLGDAPALTKALHELQQGKSSGSFVSASCGVYPSRRLIRRVTLDAKRFKDASYLNEVCIQQFRIEPDKHSLVVLNSSTGAFLDPAHLNDKEVIIAGLPNEDVITLQDSLLSSGVYPSRLEMGSISQLGAISDYLRFSKIRTPVLLLELGTEITHSFIISPNGIESSRPIPFGIESMIPVVQKKLGLKDEESAKKLFYSNTFDFTSMGAELVQRLLKELQSSIGFYEVQTGQSITQLVCTSLPAKLGWIEASIATSLGIAALKLDFAAWIKSHQLTLSEQTKSIEADPRWLGLISLMLSHKNSAANVADSDAKA